MTWPINHLTAEDLDAFHSASLTLEARHHLEECEECRTLALRDRALVERLEALPTFAPEAGFADRVMARVRRPVSVLARLREPRRLALAASLVIGIGASVVWSLLNRQLLLSWLDHSAAEISRLAWLGVRMAATSLTEQPWFGTLRGVAGSSGRLVIAGGGLLVGYGAALFALRRLLRTPSQPVPDANW